MPNPVPQTGGSVWRIVVVASAAAMIANVVAQTALTTRLARAAIAAPPPAGTIPYCAVNGLPAAIDHTVTAR